MKHYQIRFNTKAEPGDPLVWRVICEGREALASYVRIEVPCYSKESVVDGVTKWNMACDGKAIWIYDTVTIVRGL